MPSVTKEEKRAITWQGIVQGCATATILAIIGGGLIVWANDGRQDGDIHTLKQRQDRDIAEIKSEIRDLRATMCQADGEQRALLLQILQETKK